MRDRHASAALVSATTARCTPMPRLRRGKWDKFLGEPTGAAAVAYLNPKFTEWYERSSYHIDGGVSRLESGPIAGEVALLDAWEAGESPPRPDARPASLDAGAGSQPDHRVSPASLLLLQATRS